MHSRNLCYLFQGSTPPPTSLKGTGVEEAQRVEGEGAAEEAEGDPEVGVNPMDLEVLKKKRMTARVTPLHADPDVDPHPLRIPKIMKMKVPHLPSRVEVGVKDIETITMVDTQVKNNGTC